MESLYKRKGFSNVGITYKVGGAERPGFSRVTFVIDEGVLERLNKVKFFGNEFSHVCHDATHSLRCNGSNKCMKFKFSLNFTLSESVGLPRDEFLFKK